MQNANARIVAFDIGTKRIGVATANVVARLASPLTTLDAGSEDIVSDIVRLLAEQTACEVVVGLPRNMSGEDTEQTTYTRDFVAKLKKATELPIYWQDEAVTSRLSEDTLKAKGKPYERGAIDALAATYILEDYLTAKTGVTA
jgi:putative holliday junction resolvase